MPARAWLALVAAGLAIHCTTSAEDLPDVKIPVTLAQPFVDELRAITFSDVPSLSTTDVASCVSMAWSSRCNGSMSFDVDVQASGRIGEIRFHGDASPELRRCIRDVLVQGTPVPQGHGLATSATVRGGISWPKDSGTTVQFAGDSAIIPCLRTCSAGETPGGPTRGCT